MIVRIALALALIFTAVSAPADAAVLLNVRADVSPGKDARVSLIFSGGTPNFRTYGNGTTDISLVLVGTSRAPNAAATIVGKDSLKSINVGTVGDSLEVTFHESVAAKLDVTVGSGQMLIVTLAPVQAAIAPSRRDGPYPSATPAPLPADTSADEIEVVPLKYADVSEIVGLLVPGQQIAPNDVFTPQTQNFGGNGLYGGGGFGGTIGFNPAPGAGGGSGLTAFAGNGLSGGSVGQQVNEFIGVDRRLNAIILTGPPSVVAKFKAKIAKLDIPLPSVILETQVVELTDSAARDLGIDYTAGGGPTATVQYQFKTAASATGNASLQAAVYAQVSRGQGRVIARPRVAAQNGGSAQIITGDALPIVTSIAVSGVNAVSQQVQYVNVGVNLQISPRISSDGFVTSHIYSQISSVTGYQQGYPTLSQRQATTAATVKDGEAFVIGGLLQQNDITNLSKIPGIGDLPLIGSFFRVRHETRQATNLYIIVVPHIVSVGSPVPPGTPVQ
ncbi:MAG: hypothetical protein NVSMB5_12650 [Candidatus Velthaea sp.]